MYVDDIPSPPDCLHGALLCSTKPLARVKGVSFETVPKPSGIVDVISAKDIPEGGENIGAMAFFEYEYLFADDTTAFAGDIIAFVVSETCRLLEVEIFLLTVTRCFSECALIISLGCT